MNKFLFSGLIFLLLFSNLQAANSNLFVLHGIQIDRDSITKSNKKHSPKKASIFSAVVPGLGQAYNEKYWKVPIVWAALGTSAYFIQFNRKEMKTYQLALNAMYDGDSNTKVQGNLARYSGDILKAQRNYYRTNRDYSIIAFAGFYILNIIDAAVDAHFYKFNIDKPLAERKHKNWNLYSGRTGNKNTIGICLRF